MKALINILPMSTLMVQSQLAYCSIVVYSCYYGSDNMALFFDRALRQGIKISHRELVLRYDRRLLVLLGATCTLYEHSPKPSNYQILAY